MICFFHNLTKVSMTQEQMRMNFILLENFANFHCFYDKSVSVRNRFLISLISLGVRNTTTNLSFNGPNWVKITRFSKIFIDIFLIQCLKTSARIFVSFFSHYVAVNYISRPCLNLFQFPFINQRLWLSLSTIHLLTIHNIVMSGMSIF